MSAPFLSGWERKRMREREGGLKRISEAGGGGRRKERVAAEIHAAL